MQRALLEVVLIGIVGGALGCWIVFYGLSYAAESLAHAMFPGLVIAALVGVPLLVGRGRGDRRRGAGDRPGGPGSRVDREVAVAVVVTTLFGAGALLALSPHSPPGIQTLLFGDILAASEDRPGRWPAPRPRRSSSRCGSCTAGCSRSASTAPRRARWAPRPASPTPRSWS